MKNIYVVQIDAQDFSAPLAVAATEARAIELAKEAAPTVDTDGYHSIEVYELPVGALCMKPTTRSYANAETTARHVGTLRRSRGGVVKPADLNGVWEAAT